EARREQSCKIPRRFRSRSTKPADEASPPAVSQFSIETYWRRSTVRVIGPDLDLPRLAFFGLPQRQRQDAAIQFCINIAPIDSTREGERSLDSRVTPFSHVTLSITIALLWLPFRLNRQHTVLDVNVDFVASETRQF